MLRWIQLLTFTFPASVPWLAAVAAPVDNPLSFWMPLLNIGGVGAVLAFVLWKLEPRMRGAEAAVDRQTRMLAIFLIEMPHIMEAALQQCKNMSVELDSAKKKRGDPDEQ